MQWEYILMSLQRSCARRGSTSFVIQNFKFQARGLVYRFLLYQFRIQDPEEVPLVTDKIREHALIALVPILETLTRADSKLLVYALFADRYFNAILFDESLASPSAYIGDYDFEHWNPFEAFQRLFSCILPRNIIRAMIDFLLDGRFLNHYDYDWFDHSRLYVLPSGSRRSGQCQHIRSWNDSCKPWIPD